MSKVSLGYCVASSRGRQHGANENYIAELFELLSVEIIPSLVVHPLSQQFNGRLGSISFFLGHVQVVNENYNALFPFFWAELAFPSPRGHFGLDGFLNLIGSSLSGGVLDVKVEFLKFVHNVDCFTCSS